LKYIINLIITIFKDLYPKRKYACCLAYFGTSYQGLQMNPDCNSIEAQLEKALFLAGCFNENNYGHLQKLQWTRAARTDRGVHALGLLPLLMSSMAYFNNFTCTFQFYRSMLFYETSLSV
jgi:hypothetical protein